MGQEVRAVPAAKEDMRTGPRKVALAAAVGARGGAGVRQVQQELPAGHQRSLQRRPLSEMAAPLVLRVPQPEAILIRPAVVPQAEPVALGEGEGEAEPVVQEAPLLNPRHVLMALRVRQDRMAVQVQVVALADKQ